MKLIEILKAGVQQGASDIHLTVGRPPIVRMGSDLIEMPGMASLTAESCTSLIHSTLRDEQMARFEANLELDSAISIQGLGRFRLNVMMQQGVSEAVIRIVPTEIPRPAYLGLGPTALALAELPRGLVLVTGPTGSGKTTTLACLIEHINQNYARHIITIEDPVEYVYPKRKSVIRQRELGRDTRSFSDALRHALRQDPDVLLIGEMRDLDTVSLALSAAETGHLVFATLHTSEAAQTVDRIIDVFPAERHRQVRVQLAESIKGVLSQILVPRKDGRGQIAARGMMIGTHAVSNLIREGNTHQLPSVIQSSGRLGMFSVDTSLRELVRRGVVDQRDAVAKGYDPQARAESAPKSSMEPALPASRGPS